MSSGAAKYWEKLDEERLAQIEKDRQYIAGGGLLLHHNLGHSEICFSEEETRQVRTYIVHREEEWRKCKAENDHYKKFFAALKACQSLGK